MAKKPPAPKSANKLEPERDLFLTVLGWFAIEWRGRKLTRLDYLGKSEPRLSESSASTRPTWIQKIQTRIERFVRGRKDDFLDIEIDLDSVTDFQKLVLEAGRAIPYGETRSYGELAAIAGKPKAARAVGATMRSSPFVIIVPCHRVVKASQASRGDGELGLAFNLKLRDFERLKPKGKVSKL